MYLGRGGGGAYTARVAALFALRHYHAVHRYFFILLIRVRIIVHIIDRHNNTMVYRVVELCHVNAIV